MGKVKEKVTAILKQRIQKIKEIVRENQPIAHKKLITMMAIEIGLSEKTSLNMLKALQDADFVKYDPDKKVWKLQPMFVRK